MKQGKLVDDVFLDWRNKYGDVYKIQFFGSIFVITSDRNAIKEIFIDRNFPKIEESTRLLGFPFGERFMGIGIFTGLNHFIYICLSIKQNQSLCHLKIQTMNDGNIVEAFLILVSTDSN